MSGQARYSRLRWLCRRGMKELDVLLEAFLERYRQPLTSGEFLALETLLANEDDVLWDWVQGNGEPETAELQDLLALIRNATSPT